MGIENPAVITTDCEGKVNDDPNDETDEFEEKRSGCFPESPFSILESEFDEDLAFPDSVTILSDGGNNPVLVQRKEDFSDESESTGDIPITSLYNASLKFNSVQRRCFIPGVEILVKIVDTERSITSHPLNPNLYTIELSHGPCTWSIKKRYKHFNSLHQQLRVFRASLNIPFPMRSHKEKRATVMQGSTLAIPTTQEAAMANGNDKAVATISGKMSKKKLPRFPNKPESLVTVESMPIRIAQLEEYLYNLLNISVYRNHHDTLEFIEVSNVSFVQSLGAKGKEGMIQKRTGSTRPGQAGCNCFGCFQSYCCVRCKYFCSDILCGGWRNRWFFIKDTCFGYIRPTDGVIRAVVLYDQGFDVSTGMYQTGMRKGLQVVTNNRHIILKTWTRRKAKDWVTNLKTHGNLYARDFTYPNPHSSFAPSRSSIIASWLVDGSSYMNAVADAMETATEEIYIADWWLSPEIYMKRPALNGDYWRLDEILKRKASQGVKVFVMLYKEVEMALGINSYYSKKTLENKHENIKVMRHPDHAKVGVFFWAHHEKIVVIDQNIAFLGGIDLCYGRWDDYRHKLTDLGSITTNTSSTTRTKSYFDIRASVERDARNSKSSFKYSDLQEREAAEQAKLPALKPGEKLILPTSPQPSLTNERIKLNTPEMERKNRLEMITESAVRKGRDLVHRLTLNESANPADLNMVRSPLPAPAEISAKDLLFGRDELDRGFKGRGDPIGPESPQPFANEIPDSFYGSAKYWYGKDYTNFILKDFNNLDAPFVDLVDRSNTPRMPWHDVGVCVYGATARDVARHFIQRWNATKLEKTRENKTFPYLLPKSYQDIKINKMLSTPTNRVTCQVLRSVSAWSCGFIEQDLIEQSIHDAYIETISKAQHYIYIENQFFITLQFNGGTIGGVKNHIGETLFKRILRAHKERKTFRVYVIMPLLPGFEGDVGGNTGNAVRAITHWNYSSIIRGKNAILNRLKEVGVDNPSEYISFHSLRTHSTLNGSPITELIYVHSKLLIADDKVMICGSANINDRSMIGKRDSEIAVIITDEEFENGRMNGENYPSGRFCGKLRKFLFKEHLGLLDPDPNRMVIDVTDPVIDTFWNGFWKRTSLRNTEIYDTVFKCIPTDNVQSFVALKKYQEEPGLCKTDEEAADKRIKELQGFLVNLPLQFLSSEILTPPGTSKEGLIPTAVWT
ncbi:Pld family protein [Megaselia abdita]